MSEAPPFSFRRPRTLSSSASLASFIVRGGFAIKVCDKTDKEDAVLLRARFAPGRGTATAMAALGMQLNERGSVMALELVCIELGFALNGRL